MADPDLVSFTVHAEAPEQRVQVTYHAKNDVLSRSGGYSIVYKGTLQHDTKVYPVAVKVLRDRHPSKPDESRKVGLLAVSCYVFVLLTNKRSC